MSENRRDSIFLTAGALGLLVVLWVPELLPSLGGRSQLVSQAVLGMLCLSLCLAVLWRHVRFRWGTTAENCRRATVFSWWVGFSLVSLVAIFLSPWVGNLVSGGFYQAVFLALVLVVIRTCRWWVGVVILCCVAYSMMTWGGASVSAGLGASSCIGLLLCALRFLERVSRSWWAALAVALVLTFASESFLPGLTLTLLTSILVLSRVVPGLSEQVFDKRLRLPV